MHLSECLLFISLLDCKTRFSTINDLKYFLYAALKNKCLNHLRNQKVRNKYQEHLLSSPDETDNYWEHVLKEDVYASLYTAIQTLSPQCRQVMQLSLEGKKLTEIASQLHISLDTVKEYRSDSKKKLLRLLKKQDIALLIQWLWI